MLKHLEKLEFSNKLNEEKSVLLANRILTSCLPTNLFKKTSKRRFEDDTKARLARVTSDSTSNWRKKYLRVELPSARYCLFVLSNSFTDECVTFIDAAIKQPEPANFHALPTLQSRPLLISSRMARDRIERCLKDFVLEILGCEYFHESALIRKFFPLNFSKRNCDS